MTNQLTYEQVIYLAKKKIEQRDNKCNTVLIKSNLITCPVCEDAVRELVLDTCPNAALTPMSELNLVNNEYVESFKRKLDEFKADENIAFESLQKAYDNTKYFSELVSKEIAEVKSGRQSIHDMEEDLRWSYPSTFDFHECAKYLCKSLKE